MVIGCANRNVHSVWFAQKLLHLNKAQVILCYVLVVTLLVLTMTNQWGGTWRSLTVSREVPSSERKDFVIIFNLICILYFMSLQPQTILPVCCVPMLLPFYLCDTESCGFVSRPMQLEFTAPSHLLFLLLIIVHVKCQLQIL